MTKTTIKAAKNLREGDVIVTYSGRVERETAVTELRHLKTGYVHADSLGGIVTNIFQEDEMVMVRQRGTIAAATLSN